MTDYRPAEEVLADVAQVAFTQAEHPTEALEFIRQLLLGTPGVRDRTGAIRLLNAVSAYPSLSPESRGRAEAFEFLRCVREEVARLTIPNVGMGGAQRHVVECIAEVLQQLAKTKGQEPGEVSADFLEAIWQWAGNAAKSVRSECNPVYSLVSCVERLQELVGVETARLLGARVIERERQGEPELALLTDEELNAFEHQAKWLVHSPQPQTSEQVQALAASLLRVTREHGILRVIVQRLQSTWQMLTGGCDQLKGNLQRYWRPQAGVR